MSLSKRFTITLLITLLAGSVAQARNQVPQGQPLQSDVQDVQIVIQSQQVRITARSSVVEMQLQVFDQKGEMVYDSGLLSGFELSWALQNASGEAVPSGLYDYKLSVKEANAETSSLRRGHMIVERGRDRDPQTDQLWVTSQGPVGAEASLSGGEMTVSSSPEANVVGARIARTLAERSRRQRDTQGRLIAEQDDKPVGLKEGPINISGAGTTNRITKWTDGPNGVVADSTLTEVGGNIGIGTTTPITGLDYRHTLAPFLTRDIGTTNFGTPQSAIQIGVTNTGSRNVGVGPSFLFFSDDSAGQKEFLGRLSAGWENPTNGQEAGFVSFNVRANSADIGALTERMRITSAGKVGIGITNPIYKLHVVDSASNGLRVDIQQQGGYVASFGSWGDFQIDTVFDQGGRFIVKESGNVGIGFHFPNHKLHVVDDANKGLRVDTLSAGGTVASFGSNGDFQVDANGVPGGRFIVKESGNVGIGTSSPVGNLHLNVPGSPNPINALTIDVQSFFTPSNAAASYYFRARDIGAGGAPAFLIRGDGKVGIGTTNPQAALDVVGSLKVSDNSNDVNGAAVSGSSINSDGVNGVSSNIGNGVRGDAPGTGVYGTGGIYGVYGFSLNNRGVAGSSSNGYAGYFEGKVHVTGVIEKAGGGFKIDHPLDPENKYLVHSFVESPDMKNLYDGAVTTDANGEAEITLPDWFAALNRDFRYQLTCIGVFAQAIIAEKIKDNRFKIKTSLPNVEVSWQVTGTRQDAWANQNRLPVEELKPEVERGSYQNPTAFGQPEEKSMEWARHPEMMKRQKEERERRQREQNNKNAAPATQPDNR